MLTRCGKSVQNNEIQFSAVALCWVYRAGNAPDPRLSTRGETLEYSPRLEAGMNFLAVPLIAVAGPMFRPTTCQWGRGTH